MGAPLTNVLAIDPGTTGAVAFFFPAAPERVAVYDLPVVASEVDAGALARRLRQLGPTIGVIELVGPMKGDGARQAFRFGAAFATARTVITMLDLPLHQITPQEWKRFYKLQGGPEGKEAARALAIRLFPASAEHFELKKHHNRAEAALLARYFAERERLCGYVEAANG